MLNVLLASPYPAMRAGLQVLLAEAGRGLLSVAGEADSPEVCLEWALAARPQVILYDLSLEADDEMRGLWQLHAQCPAPVLALADDDPRRMLAALQAGARGCLPKTSGGAELVEAIASLAHGEAILPPGTTAALLDHLRGEAPVEALTPREVEVLQHVAAGLTNKAIALKLEISEHTVKFHLGAAMSKLGAASRAEAVATAMRRGLILI